MNASIIDEINTHFHLPIYYNDKKIKLDNHIIKDLELMETVADSSCNPIYQYCFNHDNDISLQLNTPLCSYYTSDVEFLKDNQTLLKTYKCTNVKYTHYSSNYKNIVDIWNELKINTHFKEKYCFVDWDILDFLNRSETFLQCMSIYNLLSPLVSLIIPIIILIVPFFVIQMKGLDISIHEYISILKTVANENAIGKLFVVNFKEISTQEKVTVFVSAVFYLFSIYQNFNVCIKFNNNMTQIHNYFNEMRIYLDHTIQSMENYITYAKHLESSAHVEFLKVLGEKIQTLTMLQSKIAHISDYNMFNIGKIKEIGYVFKCFYELHSDHIYHEVFLFSLGFHGYMDCLSGLQQNLESGAMNYCSFIEHANKGVFENSYYACLKNEHPVKNTVKFKKNMIITGPNASGKTTILKSTLINVLFSQQFGCGFYEYARFQPFQHIHCYLNIPDTSGRDSLFQAEARRCKEILDSIHDHKQERHFCVFDELYSGTNPEEAEQSAASFMKYLTKYKNVQVMLTTHFTKICKKLASHARIENYQMVAEKQNNILHYTYLCKKGISNVKGGIIVLEQMNYPSEIIHSIQ